MLCCCSHTYAGLSHSAIPPAPTPSIPTPPTQARTTTTPVTITYNPNDVSDDGGFYGLFSGEIDPELNLLPQSHCALQPTANQCAASPANKVQPSAGKRALAPHSAHRAPALRTPSTSGSKGSSWDADARECEEDNCGFCELFDFGSIDLEDNFLPESLQERLRWSMESKAASAKRGELGAQHTHTHTHARIHMHAFTMMAPDTLTLSKGLLFWIAGQHTIPCDVACASMRACRHNHPPEHYPQGKRRDSPPPYLYASLHTNQERQEDRAQGSYH